MMGQVFMRDSSGRTVASWLQEEWAAMQVAMHTDDRSRAKAIYAAGIVAPTEAG